MLRKRLTRDLKWGFQNFPYYQMRIDMPIYYGFASLIELVDGQYCYWDFPLSGKTAVCGAGMCWLQLIPDNKNRLITIMYKKLDDNRIIPKVSAWYVDVINGFDIDDDGVIVFNDLYLDVIFTPYGDVIIDDRDELEEAYKTGDICEQQYELALREGECIVDELCRDIKNTERICGDIFRQVKKQISEEKINIKNNV